MSKSNFFTELFLFFNKEGLGYAIMNGYEEYPIVIDSDIDICVESISRFEEILQSSSSCLDFKLIQRLEHHHECINYFIAKNYGEKWVILSLDVYVNYKHKGNVLFDSSWFLSERQKRGFFYVPKSENELIYYLVKKIIKQDIDDRVDWIYGKYSELDVFIDFSMLFPRSNEDIINALNSGKKDYFIESKLKLKNELEANLKKNVAASINELLRCFKRCISPTGITIAFLGPDGSGKSTIIETIGKIEIPFRRMHYFHLKPGLFSANNNRKPVLDPHAKKAYPGLLSYLKLLHFISNYWLGYPSVLNKKIHSTLIVFDRYYDDFYVDPKRFRYGGSVWLAKFMKKFLPQPDITFVLFADPEIIYVRKQEVEFTELERQLKEYKSLVAEGYILIDVNRPVEKIIKEINTHIYRRLNERY